jgi:hypothetical protein
VTLEQLRDLSVVILGVETFFLCLVLAAVLFIAIRGTSQAILKVRIYGPVARGYFRRMAGRRANQPQDHISFRVRELEQGAHRENRVRSVLSLPSSPRGIIMQPRTIKLTIIGALIGAVLGGTAAWAISKVQENRLPPELRTGQELSLTASPQDFVGLAVSLVAVVRQVVQLFKPG